MQHIDDKPSPQPASADRWAYWKVKLSDWFWGFALVAFGVAALVNGQQPMQRGEWWVPLIAVLCILGGALKAAPRTATFILYAVFITAGAFIAYQAFHEMTTPAAIIVGASIIAYAIWNRR